MELLSEVTLCRGRRVELLQRVYLHEGKEFLRDVVRFGQAVAALPLIGDEVLLVRQFRHAVNDWVLEIPAGRVEGGEGLEDAIVRELIEEIGYSPRRVERIVSVYMAPGYSDEVLHIFLATDLEYVGPKPELGEFIEVVRLKVSDLVDTLLKCRVIDAKTLVAVATYLKLRGLLNHKLGRPQT